MEFFIKKTVTKDRYGDEHVEEEIRVSRIVAVGVVAIILILTALLSFKIIPTGYVGVKTTFGQVSQSVMHPGFNWKIPYVQSISKICTKQQDASFDEQIWGETSERTAVYFEKTVVTYSINGDKASWIYANVSDYKKSLVSTSLVTSAVKSASKTLSPTDVTNRSIVEPLIMKMLQESIDSKYGKDVVFINKVTVNDIDFEESYQKNMAAKQNAQLEYEKQKIENQKAVEKAEADASAKLKTAEADAEAKRIAAQAEADANKKISDSLTDKILENRYYDKWDGKLPEVVGSENVGIIRGFEQTNAGK